MNTPIPETTAKSGDTPRPSPAAADNARRDNPTSGGDASVLTLVRPIAAIGIAAMILGRAVGPSVLGVAVGWNRASYWVQFVGAALSQFFSMLAIVVAVALGLATLRSKLPARLRIASAGCAGVVVVTSLLASITRLPPWMAAAIGTAAGVAAIASAWEAQKAPVARAAAMILGLFGVSALLRVLSMALLLAAPSAAAPSAVVTGIARGLATACFVLDACAAGLSIAWIASRNQKLMTPATLLAVGTALVCWRYAMIGTEEAGAAVVLLRRVADRLAVHPPPYFPPAICVFLAFLTPLVAVAALFTTSLVAALSGAIALSLLGRGSAEVPLGALSLLMAALAVPLAARDERGLWRSLMSKPPR